MILDNCSSISLCDLRGLQDDIHHGSEISVHGKIMSTGCLLHMLPPPYFLPDRYPEITVQHTSTAVPLHSRNFRPHIEEHLCGQLSACRGTCITYIDSVTFKTTRIMLWHDYHLCLLLGYEALQGKKHSGWLVVYS